MRVLLALVFLAAWSISAAVPVAQWEFDLVLTRTPDARNGAELYGPCAACHGKNGEGVSDGTVPVLAGQSYTVIAKQLVDFRADRRVDPRMQHFSDRRHLAYSQSVADVAAYIAGLPKPMPKRSVPEKAIIAGSMAYVRSCERCHGAMAEGKEDTLAPRLASQHYDYLLRQLDDAAAGRRATMAETHAPLLRVMSRTEIETVASYLATLR